MATGSEGVYVVEHRRVAVRDAPSIKAEILTVVHKGDDLCGTPFEVDGLPWLRLAPYTMLRNAEEVVGEDDSAWVLIDGSSTELGVGQLLKRMADGEEAVGSKPSKGGNVESDEQMVKYSALAPHELVDVLEAGAAAPDEGGGLAESGATLTVRCLSGAAYEVPLEDYMDLQDLKVAIETVSGIPRREQRVLRGVEELSEAAFDDMLRVLPAGGKGGCDELTLIRRDPVQARWLLRVKQDWQRLKVAPEEVRGDMEILSAAVEQNWQAVLHAAPELLCNRELVLAAVRKDWHALEHAALELKADREVVIAAIRQSWEARVWVVPHLLEDREVAEAAVRRWPEVLRDLHPSVRADRGVVLTAVRKDGSLLAHAAEALRADSEVVLAAVKQRGEALEHAAAVCRANREVVLAAVQRSPAAFRHASPELFADRELVLRAARGDPSMLGLAAGALVSDDPDVALAAAAARRSPQALTKAGQSLRSDRDIVLAAVTEDWHLLESAHEDLRADPEVVIAAARQNSTALKLAAPGARRHPKVALLTDIAEWGAQGWQDSLKAAPAELREDRDVVMAIVAVDAEAFKHLPSHFWKDREVMMAAVQAHGSALRFASQRLKSDLEIVAAAVRQDRNALEFAGSELQKVGIDGLSKPTAENDSKGGRGDDRLWRVIGGRSQGGLLIRHAAAVASEAFVERLAVGAVIRELRRKGQRLNYEKVSGPGPMSGWVSLSAAGKALLEELRGSPLVSPTH